MLQGTRVLLAVVLCLAVRTVGAVEPVSEYHGEIGNELEKALPNAAHQSGVVVDEASFTKLWAAWSKEVEPKIDFAKHFVYVDLHDAADPNRRNRNIRVDDKDYMEVIIMSTRMGFQDSNRSKFAMLVIPRAGIKGVYQWVLEDGKMVKNVFVLPAADAKGKGTSEKPAALEAKPRDTVPPDK